MVFFSTIGVSGFLSKFWLYLSIFRFLVFPINFHYICDIIRYGDLGSDRRVELEDFLRVLFFIHIKLILDGTCYINPLKSIYYFFHTSTCIFAQFTTILTDNHNFILVVRLSMLQFIYYVRINFVGIFTQFYLFLSDSNLIFIARLLYVHFIM